MLIIIPFLHSFTTLYLRGIRNRKQKKIDSVILMIDYSKFCLSYSLKVFEKMYFGNFMYFFEFWIFWIFFDFFWFFWIFSKKSEGVLGFFRVDNPSGFWGWIWLSTFISRVCLDVDSLDIESQHTQQYRFGGRALGLLVLATCWLGNSIKIAIKVEYLRNLFGVQA